MSLYLFISLSGILQITTSPARDILDFAGVNERKSQVPSNLSYFLTELLRIEEVKEWLKKILVSIVYKSLMFD